MSKERYGIRRFALLNTAGYSLGLFPLEEPLSVYGANNLGKSASINALQFPILARMSDMSFGKYTLEQSRRFYFATDTSYILVEVSLPHGPHVIGVVGRGPGGGFGHQFFAYAGKLDLAHYQKNDTCLRQKELFTNLEREGLKAYELKPDELRRLLVGGQHVDPAGPDADPAAFHQRTEPEDLPRAVYQPAAHARNHRGQAQAIVPRCV